MKCSFIIGLRQRKWIKDSDLLRKGSQNFNKIAQQWSKTYVQEQINLPSFLFFLFSFVFPKIFRLTNLPILGAVFWIYSLEPWLNFDIDTILLTYIVCLFYLFIFVMLCRTICKTLRLSLLKLEVVQYNSLHRLICRMENWALNKAFFFSFLFLVN